MPKQQYYGDKYNQGDFNWTTKFGKKPKTEGEKIDTGTYTEEGPIDTGDLGPDGKPLMSATNPLEDLTINPNRETLTQRQKEREDRLRQRAGSGQQGADIAKKKLPKSKQTDLPQFLQSAEMDEVYSRDSELYGEFDDLVEAARNATGREKKALLQRAGRVREQIETGKDPMTIGELPGAAWGVAESYGQSIMEDPAAMSEHTLDMFADFQAASKGYQAGSRFGPKGAIVGTIGGVALRRGGKELIERTLANIGKFTRKISHRDGGELVYEAVGGGQRFKTKEEVISNIFQSKKIDNTSSVGKSNVTNLPPQGMSVRNNQLFKNLGFEDWEKYFVGAWEDLSDPISRNFNAAVSNDKYSWNTFDRVRRETLPLVMEEYAGIADIKWPRKGPELHHINAIKATMPLFEGLARNERKELLKVLMREGIYAGHDPNNLMQLPHAVHKSVTKLWNDKIGKSGKLFFERDKDGLFKAAQLPFEERKILAKNYAKVVKDLELTTLKMAKDYKAISKDGLARKLDKELKTQFNIANFENFILTGKYLGDEVSPEAKQIFKSRSVKNIKKRTKK